MVDWDRVQELRSKGWDWSDIAKDPKVGFHPEASAGDPARALRALYHRTGRRTAQASAEAAAAKKPSKEATERKWTLTRVGYLGVPAIGVWFLLAFVAPSPIGLLLPAIPYLALALAGFAFVLSYALWRKTEGRRWTTTYRNTVIGGVVVGVVLAGAIGLAGSVVFGCPYLPPASTLSDQGQGWNTGPLPLWQENGKPVVFFYGATWCPYCSASSWAVYKALTAFATVSNVQVSHSSLSDVYKGTPEVVISSLQLGPKNGNGPAVALQAAEDTSGVADTLPATSTCYQQAYVSSYANGIPFVVLNGQQVHIGTLVDPAGLEPWNYANYTNGTGPDVVLGQVNSESGAAWTAVQTAAWWMITWIAKDLGYSSSTVTTLKNDYGWSTATTSAVTTDLQSLGD